MSTPPANHRPRRAGSARFSTYYKVQYWDAHNCAWADIQILAYTIRQKAKAEYQIKKPAFTMAIGRRAELVSCA
jgi:hypothetical protein